MENVEQGASTSVAASPSKIPAPPSKLLRSGLRPSSNGGATANQTLLPSPMKMVSVNTSLDAQPRTKTGVKSPPSGLDMSASGTFGKGFGSPAQGK
jgi:hypothetical protein